MSGSVAYTSYDKNPFRAHLPIIDSGYSKICVFCNKRHAASERLIGKERWVEISPCEICIGKGLTRRSDKYKG